MTYCLACKDHAACDAFEGCRLYGDSFRVEARSREQSVRDAVLVLKDAAIKDGVSDDVAAAIAFLDLLTRP